MFLLSYFRNKRFQKYQNQVLSKFGFLGTNHKITFPIKLINPQYMKIGDNFYIGPGSRLEAWDFYEPTSQKFTPKIIIGNDVKINGELHLGAINEIIIGNGVLMGAGVFITDHSHGRGIKEEINIDPNNRKLYSKGKVIINDRVWLCERVTVLPGVEIGEGSIIGAGSIVTHSIPPFSIAAGNPAIVKANIMDRL